VHGALNDWNRSPPARKAGASEAHVRFLDVGRTESVNDFMAWAKGKLGTRDSERGTLHVLVNNAGGAHGLDTVAEGKDEDWEAMMQSNVLGVLHDSRGVAADALDAGASILNIGSVASRSGMKAVQLYCAKAAELFITRSLRLELCDRIRVSTIDPGLAETEFSLVRFKGDVEKAGHSTYERSSRRKTWLKSWCGSPAARRM
jgi:NADP-dependent 3-hydroxy acid dehydrogenase YdfG